VTSLAVSLTVLRWSADPILIGLASGDKVYKARYLLCEGGTLQCGSAREANRSARSEPTWLAKSGIHSEPPAGAVVAEMGRRIADHNAGDNTGV
jgi:hypothetical protein